MAEYPPHNNTCHTAEYIFGTDKGLGFFTVDAWMRLDYIKMYAGIVSISVIGFLLFVAIDIADAVFCRWNRLMSRY